MTWNRLLESRAFPLVLLPGLWGLAFLVNLSARDLRWEEGRRATPAREMLASGNFVTPTLYGDIYLNKPPGFFWVIAGMSSWGGQVNEWTVRFPSAVAALGCAWLAYVLAAGIHSRQAGAVAGLFCLSSTCFLDKGTYGEIDCLLTLVVVGALAIWWLGYRNGQLTVWYWLGFGVLVGITGLIKGPGGALQIYPALLLFLIWQRDVNALLTMGHAIALLVSVAPALVWIICLMQTEGFTMGELAKIWSGQLGINVASDGVQPNLSGLTFQRYALFPFHVLGMALPGVLWVWPAAFRAKTEQSEKSSQAQRFLLSCILGPLTIMWIWPSAVPRYVMASVPMLSVLAAIGVECWASRSWPQWAESMNRALGKGLSWTPLVLGFIGMIFVGWRIPEYLLAAAVVALLCSVWSFFLARLNRNWSSGVQLPATLSVVVLLGFFAVAGDIKPWVARRDFLRQARLSLTIGDEEAIPRYTTFTFPHRGEGTFNLQFYLGQHLRGVGQVEQLAGVAPCVAIVSPDELARLQQLHGYQVTALTPVIRLESAQRPMVVAKIAPVALMIDTQRDDRENHK